jgi:AcrR family transcriptional regulator
VMSDRRLPPSRRSGRRAGQSNSHELILDAARAEFSAHGFQGTTMRAIADTAGVDAALIHHFFLSKGGLFIAAVQEVFTVAGLVSLTVDGPVDGLGERFARTYLSHWDDLAIGLRLVSLLRSATSFEGAATLIREFLAETLLPVTVAVGREKPELRAALLGSYLVGIAALRYVVSDQPSALMSTRLEAGIAVTCQYYLYERL